MKVLFLTPQLPFPARQGTAIRNAGLMQHVAAQHTVAFVSFLAPGQVARQADPAHATLLGSAPQPRWPVSARLSAFVRGQPDLAWRLWSQAFVNVLEVALREFRPDIVQIEGLELAAYIDVIRQDAPHARIVFDAHNAEHVIQRRAWQVDRCHPRRWPAAAYSAIQARRLWHMEGLVGRRVDAVCCVSLEDAEALHRLGLESQPVVIPNGVHPADYDVEAHRGQAGLGPGDLVFTGKMDYRPNLDAMVWFAQEVLPRVRARQPSARLVVVGQQPGRALASYAGRSDILITGAVEDTRPYIAGGAVYIAPLRMGGGTRFKLLEAMALARPVVSTRLGAEGLAVADERELLLADEPHALADACLRLLADPDLARQLGQAGRRYVFAHHDWAVIGPRLEAVYSALAAGG